MKCCVKNCTSKSVKGCNISFHPFPNQENRQELWLSSLKIPKESLLKYKHLRVCSKHFIPSDYLFGTNIKKLKKSAVPFIDKENVNPNCESGENVDATIILKKRRLDHEDNLHDNDREYSSLKTTIHEQKAEIERLRRQVSALEKEVAYLTLENDKVKANIREVDAKTPCFSFKRLENDNRRTLYYTGFETFAVMDSVYNFLLPSNNANDLDFHSKGYIRKTNSYSISPKEQFLLTMMRLRRGFNIKTLTDLFYISQASAGKIILGWINIMYIRLGNLNIWPHRNILIDNAPERVREQFENVLGSIDCTEFAIETPSSLVKQSQCYSNYKGATTVKSLLMTDNNGGIIYISPLFTGSISDKNHIVESGFLDVLKTKLKEKEVFEGDVILADKGFNVASLIEDVNININIPTFRLSGTQFTSTQVEWTRKIAQERVHVERAICRLKQYRILTRKIPISLLGSIEQIHTVCCILTIFRNRLRY